MGALLTERCVDLMTIKHYSNKKSLFYKLRVHYTPAGAKHKLYLGIIEMQFHEAFQ